MVHGSKTQQFLKPLACIEVKFVKKKLCHSGVKIVSGLPLFTRSVKLLMANVSNSDLFISHLHCDYTTLNWQMAYLPFVLETKLVKCSW